MLEDHKRTGAYYNACMQNRAQFAGKVVLDVGTGSGILAIFAAKAGGCCRLLWVWAAGASGGGGRWKAQVNAVAARMPPPAPTPSKITFHPSTHPCRHRRAQGVRGGGHRHGQERQAAGGGAGAGGHH